MRSGMCLSTVSSLNTVGQWKQPFICNTFFWMHVCSSKKWLVVNTAVEMKTNLQMKCFCLNHKSQTLTLIHYKTPYSQLSYWRTPCLELSSPLTASSLYFILSHDSIFTHLKFRMHTRNLSFVSHFWKLRLP